MQYREETTLAITNNTEKYSANILQARRGEGKRKKLENVECPNTPCRC
jgi:hypothetical protein